jgi:hypothetical protein
MQDATTIEALERRVAELEALVASLVASRPEARPPLGPADPPGRPRAGVDEEGSRLDRRRLLARGGTAAVGAVLGGAAASIATAAPAAAATGAFDTSTATPALTASTSGTGAAVSASSTSDGHAISATGTASVVGMVEVSGTDTVLDASSRGDAHAIAVGVHSDGAGVLASADKQAVIAVSNESEAVWATGETVGALLGGNRAQLLLGGAEDPGPGYMPPPRTRTDLHAQGEVYLDHDADLWLCVVDGSPGTWVRLAGRATAGALTILATPVRVFDTRDGSGLPGAGTGPITGIRTDIDLRAASSGLPTDATAALVTLTVTGTIGATDAYGQIYANGLGTPPGTSSINWTDGDSLVATTTTTAVTDGRVTVSMNPGADVLIDVLGYHR